MIYPSVDKGLGAGMQLRYDIGSPWYIQKIVPQATSTTQGAAP